MLTPRSDSVALTRRLTIESAAGRRVLLYGAESPHTSENPFVIRLHQVRDANAIIDWMTIIAAKGWGATPADLLTLAQVLLDDVEERASAPSEHQA